MPSKPLPLPLVCILALALSAGCAYTNIKRDEDDHPVFNTGVGARVLLPGESSAMPPAHPGYQLPGSTPVPGQVGARGPQGQPLPAPQPAPSATIGGAPTTTVQSGPGSTSSAQRGPSPSSAPSGDSGITFIGGSEIDEDTHEEHRQEPRYFKYLLAPFAIAAYPFTAVWNAITKDDGPPPPRANDDPQSTTLQRPPPVDMQTAHEQSQLEALERELAGQPGAAPAPTRAMREPRFNRPTPSGDSIEAELAALQRGIAPKLPAGSAATQSQPQASGVHHESDAEAQPSAPVRRGGVADHVTDRNRDGRPDHWIYRQDGQRVRELFDEDADGTPDRYIYYQSENGESRREEEDTNLDGEIDSWLEYRSGKVIRHRRDSNGDGFLDTWSFYRAGELARQERDLNGDGYRDRVGFYEDGRLTREEEDRNGDGRPDRVTRFDEQERILQRDDDRNGDGVVDLRSYYSEGNLVRRELVEAGSDELIEEDELASAAWSDSEAESVE